MLLQRTVDEKVSKEPMHLHLETDGVEAEVQRLEALGATRWDHQQSVGTTFGCCTIPEETSSAFYSRSSLNC